MLKRSADHIVASLRTNITRMASRVAARRAFVITVALTAVTPGFAQDWIARYNGPGNGEDKAFAMVVDDSGNVYVTGESLGSGTNYDYATVKYDPGGNTMWVARYNGPGNDYDRATAVGIDHLRNVYVTGTSMGLDTSCDYATVKYNSSGDEMWVARYDGPVCRNDAANGLAVDDSGYIYVTGGSDSGPGTGRDFATIKYSPSGDRLWLQRYDGDGNKYDEADAITVDEMNNIYVVGRSEGSGTCHDYATVKYNCFGDEQWAKRYDGPGSDYDRPAAVAVDDERNVYTTGDSNEGSSTYYDYATVKYNTVGVEQWVQRYHGPVDHDGATAIAVDKDGNIYVTGQSEGEGTSYDYLTIAYNASGDTLWVRRFDGSAEYDGAVGIAVDDSGNVCVTGVSIGSGSSCDYGTIKYDPKGEELWVARYNGPVNGYDNASAIAIDDSNCVYVTGSSEGTGTNYDYATIKYLPCGPGVEEEANDQLSISNRQLAIHPNPFTHNTVVEFVVRSWEFVDEKPSSLKIYDLGGRLIRSFPFNHLTIQPFNQITWDGRDNKGNEVEPGIYFVRFTDPRSGGRHSLAKVVKLK